MNQPAHAPKATIIILSDPAGGEEALGRAFNALAAAHDFKRRGRFVRVVFQGAGTRWPAALAKADHPAHGLYEAIADTVAGASAGCAVVFGSEEDVKRHGLQLLNDNPVPGTPGLPSLEAYAAEGPVFTF